MATIFKWASYLQKLTLKYYSDKINTQYFEFQQNLNKKQIIQTRIIFFIYLIVMLFSNIYYQHQISDIIMKAIHLIINVVLVITNFKIVIENGCLLNFLNSIYLIIHSVQDFKYYLTQSQMNENMNIFNISVISCIFTYMLFVILSCQQQWFMKSFLIIFYSIFSSVCLESMESLYIVCLSIGALILSIFYYYDEYNKKIQFLKVFNEKKDLNCWKSFFQEKIPFPCFIVKRGKQLGNNVIESLLDCDLQIHFANTTCLKYFRIDDKDELREIVKGIFIANNCVKYHRNNNKEPSQFQQQSQDIKDNDFLNLNLQPKNSEYQLKTNNNIRNVSTYNIQHQGSIKETKQGNEKNYYGDLSKIQFNYSLNQFKSLQEILISKFSQHYQSLANSDYNTQKFAKKEERCFAASKDSIIYNAFSQNYINNKFEEQKFYDIEIIDCFWEKQYSLMIFVKDISQTIVNDRLKQLDEYKDQLLATVTHDLKTPINCILTMIDALENNKEIDAEQLKNLEIIKKNGQMLHSMISDILDYSQINNGKLRLNIEQFNLCDLLNEVKAIFEFQFKQKQLTFNTYFLMQSIDNNLSFNSDNVGEELFITNDPIRVKQILFNLVSNALKYTFAGSVNIIIEQLNDPPQCLGLKVQDTGVGIPNNIINQLFQLYATFDHNAKQTNKQGTGLGLVMCKKLAGYLGPYSEISVESQESKGSTFGFIIYQHNHQQIYNASPNYQNSICNQLNLLPNDQSPSNYMETSKERELLERKQKQIPKFTNKTMSQKKQLLLKIKKKESYVEMMSKSLTKPTKILVVDDTIFNIVTMKIMLKCIKLLNIDEAYNGQQAIDKVKKNKYDLIIMDMDMPVMDGIQTTKKLKEMMSKKEIQNSIIMISSAYSSEKEQTQAKIAGADLYNIKPIKSEDILDALLNHQNLFQK